MVINTNIHALGSARNLQQSQAALGKSLARLSSGNKIVNPSDDAAGLAVSEKLDAQNRRVDAARDNVQNAISYVQTADGFMKSMTRILTRMSELTMLAKDVTKNTDDLSLYNQEFEALKDQLRSTIGGTAFGVAADTQPLGTYNGISIFAAGAAKQMTIGEGVGQTMSLATIDLRSGAMATLLSTSAEISVSSATARGGVIDTIQQVATERAKLGATQSRLEIASTMLSVQSENLEAAISRIRDVDVAEETTEYARYNILVQSGTAMLAQANQLPQSVLRLLQ
jgi:flagellin